MIELKPNSYRAFDCPACASGDVEVSDTVFQGIHVLADCRCVVCGLEFYHEYPVGNALRYPTVFGKLNGVLYSGVKVPWYSKPLLTSYQNKCNDDIVIEKRVYQRHSSTIILNCLDFLYGHVLLKLLNAQYYLDNCPEHGLIVIIPRKFAWLVPAGVAEVWQVDIGIYSGGQRWLVRFDEFVRREMMRFDRVFLSLAFSVPDFSNVDITRFTRVAPFSLADYSNSKPTITFILREDRLWYGSASERFAYLVCKKLKLLPYIRSVFLRSQSRRIMGMFKVIMRQIPDASCEVVGLCTVGPFRNGMESNQIDEQIERAWCERYARSHVVIGVHGSNMLLPTAHAAGFIEVLPKSRNGNIVQDIASPHIGRKLLFLGRFVREFVSPREVADLAVAMIKDFEGFEMYMDYETLRHDCYADARHLKARET